jgi:hydrogenase maturation protease
MARVIGIGQASVGDDAVGLAVVRELRDTGPPPGVEVFEVVEAAALVPLLETAQPVVLVDAVMSGPGPGHVLDVPAEQLAMAGVTPASTHGLGVREAIELARILFPDTLSPRISVVGVTIARPDGYRQGLSPEVVAAVPAAVEAVLARVRS